MKPVIVLGGGGHARVLLDALRLRKIRVLGVTDKAFEVLKKQRMEVPVLGTDEAIFEYSPKKVRLVNGLGSVRDAGPRTVLFHRLKERGYIFESVIHPAAILAKNVRLGEGIQVMAGAVLQPGCRLGANVVVNTRASVDHDCVIHDHVFIAPGVTVSGGVEIGEGSHIGTGAAIIQGVKIGKRCLIGAGEVVTEDLKDGERRVSRKADSEAMPL